MPAIEAHAPSPGSASREQTCVRFWGTRSSIPSPAPTTVGYGGTTSCVKIRGEDIRLILDAGAGVRTLGTALKGDVPATVAVTHFRWDRIQGLPFFGPLHDSGSRLDLLAAAQLPSPLRPNPPCALPSTRAAATPPV